MRGRLTGIVMLISITILTFTALKGIKIGKFEILSVSQLQEKNNGVNERINDASVLTSINYPDNIETLEETYNRYIVQKQKYENLSEASADFDEEIYETKQYDIGYLWRVLGDYATNRSLDLGIVVEKNNLSKNSYNINFTVTGKYSNIIKFLRDIENDSDLYFRIYNFRIAGSGEIVTATFVVRNVNIDPTTIN